MITTEFLGEDKELSKNVNNLYKEVPRFGVSVRKIIKEHYELEYVSYKFMDDHKIEYNTDKGTVTFIYN